MKQFPRLWTILSLVGSSAINPTQIRAQSWNNLWLAPAGSHGIIERPGTSNYTGSIGLSSPLSPFRVASNTAMHIPDAVLNPTVCAAAGEAARKLAVTTEAKAAVNRLIAGNMDALIKCNKIKYLH